MSTSSYQWKPLSPETWSDFELLFGPRGACGGCWCMTWRISKKDFDAGKQEGNRLAMRALVDAGSQPGVLLYENGRAIGWCSLAPRSEFIALGRSKVWAPVDEKPVWSVTCFFVDKSARGRGVTVALLRAAIEFARSKGAKLLEGYPQQLKKWLPNSFVWTGIYASFVRAGFVEVARRSANKPIMRFTIE